MKVLIIILALVGISFVGLLIYGSSKNQEPKKACERIPANKKDGDAWKDWCPPSLADSTRGLQARFGPGLGQGTQTVELGQSGGGVSVNPKIGKKVRTAKLSLKAGNFALAKGPEDAVVCLCRRGSSIPPTLLSQCSPRWQSKNPGICAAGYDRDTMPFGQFGGQITFPAPGLPATVEVK
jgi:hypothetical protein